MTETNRRLAAIFHDLAAIYRYEGDERFRELAYATASQVMKNLPEDITYYVENKSFNELPGIGETMRKNIKEYLKTGKVARLEKLKKHVPFELLGLMDVRGFGPKTLRKICQSLHVKTREGIIKAVQDGSVSKLKGFGSKKAVNLMRGLNLHKAMENRMVLWEALDRGDELVKYMRACPQVRKIELAGSLRRKNETIGDFDLLIASGEYDREKVMDYFTSPKLAKKVLAKGDTRAGIVLKGSGKQVDLRVVNEEDWGAALQYFTGSKAHNIHLRSIARDRGFKINEYGIFKSTGKRLAGKSEEEIYAILGMDLMPPEMREDRGEIALAARHKIPNLVELSDIKGDLHVHSDWSDGTQTLEALGKYAMDQLHYEYIAITDHSKSARVAGGMDEKGFLKQIVAIRKVNERFGKEILKAGAEVDILADGSLDLSGEVLAQLDWVIASIHSGFSRDNTNRLIKACESPFVHCLGHLTGRLIGIREGYPVDVDRLMMAAKETGTMLEINSQPLRMDVNDVLATRAREIGVGLVINTDCHHPSEFDRMRLGIYIARRAWCTPEEILNTSSWKEVQKRISMKKRLQVA